ncbi:hypothetical protein HK100_005264 [Physocladia obscura]|uniref:Uncharacterized protein n=1 Tax=Physocladia obscura TaxID=109957 RepID=A0AAD5XFI7_9FUNG|nr:hypothetical protein HK100_005264 [Physocladia obscura]
MVVSPVLEPFIADYRNLTAKIIEMAGVDFMMAEYHDSLNALQKQIDDALAKEVSLEDVIANEKEHLEKIGKLTPKDIISVLKEKEPNAYSRYGPGNEQMNDFDNRVHKIGVGINKLSSLVSTKRLEKKNLASEVSHNQAALFQKEQKLRENANFISALDLEMKRIETQSVDTVMQAAELKQVRLKLLAVLDEAFKLGREAGISEKAILRDSELKYEHAQTVAAIEKQQELRIALSKAWEDIQESQTYMTKCTALMLLNINRLGIVSSMPIEIRVHAKTSANKMLQAAKVLEPFTSYDSIPVFGNTATTLLKESHHINWNFSKFVPPMTRELDLFQAWVASYLENFPGILKGFDEKRIAAGHMVLNNRIEFFENLASSGSSRDFKTAFLIPDELII